MRSERPDWISAGLDVLNDRFGEIALRRRDPLTDLFDFLRLDLLRLHQAGLSASAAFALAAANDRSWEMIASMVNDRKREACR